MDKYAGEFFSVRLKRELCEVEVKKQCCRRAETFGMLLSGASGDGETVSLSLREEVAPLAKKRIREQFTREPEEKKRAGNSVLLTFSSRAAARFLADPESLSSFFRCPECAASAIRGMFLSGGGINAPTESNYFQIATPEFERCLAAKTAAASVGIDFFAGKRRDRHFLYLKKRQAIEDVLAILGAKQCYFEYLNAGIEKNARNDANRASNFITSNIRKTVDTAQSQTKTIRRLAEEGKLSRLPPELQETAKARLENPSLSLERLGLLFSPPVSKSGMYHRLEKIMAFARETDGTGKNHNV